MPAARPWGYQMRRRAFITLLGGAAVGSPTSASAQQPPVPVVGYLAAGSSESGAKNLAAFLKGLSEIGFIEGRNVAIEYRYANSQFGHLPELAADLVRHKVAVIAVVAGSAPARAAKTATMTIPIVFGMAGDPVRDGLVESFNRPGGNATGFSNMAVELTAKRLGLLHELLPSAVRFAVLIGPDDQNSTEEARIAAASLGKQIEIIRATTNRDIEIAFTSLLRLRADGLLVNASNLFGARRAQLTTLAAHHRMPVIYYDRPYPEAGGLMSYGANIADQATAGWHLCRPHPQDAMGRRRGDYIHRCTE